MGLLYSNGAGGGVPAAGMNGRGGIHGSVVGEAEEQGDESSQVFLAQWKELRKSMSKATQPQASNGFDEALAALG
jgi:hypothetical protein